MDTQIKRIHVTMQRPGRDVVLNIETDYLWGGGLLCSDAFRTKRRNVVPTDGEKRKCGRVQMKPPIETHSFSSCAERHKNIWIMCVRVQKSVDFISVTI